MLTDHTRQTTPKKTLTREENNLNRYFHALLDEGNVPSVSDYAPYGDLSDIAAEMSAARVKDGIAGLKKYLVTLGRIKDSKYKRLVTILSSATPSQAEEALNEPEKVGILLSEVRPEKIDWLWYPRFALGKIAMLDGDPGMGKSNITLDIAARVSTGKQMPNEPSGSARGAGVVLITPEDGLADTIVPRLLRAGANLQKMVSITTVPTTNPTTGFAYHRPFTLPDDLPLLEAAIKRVEAKLVIIDPVMAVLGGGRDAYRDNEVRSILAPVQMLLEASKVACILVHHLNKGATDNILYRGGGSIAFIGVSRTGFMVLKEPGEDGRTVLAHVKSNIGKLAPPLAFSITSAENDERPYITWKGTSEYSVAEMLSPSTQKPSEGRQEIMTLLKEKYPEGMSPTEIAEELELEPVNVRMALNRMVKAGQIDKPARGIYVAKPE